MDVRQVVDYYVKRKEHYPISDEFIKSGMRQEKGGYVDFAKKTGHCADMSAGEPDQKFHFLMSYILRSLADGTIKALTEDFAEYYNGLSCPELVLWIAEAGGVDAGTLTRASEEAKAIICERGNRGRVSAAAAIRRLIPWSSVESSIADSGRF